MWHLIPEGAAASLHLSLFEAGGGEAAPVAARASFEAEERRVLVQAAAVRIPKAAGQMTQAVLVDALAEALSGRFRVDAALARRALDYLIDKEYIARSGELYTYVA